MTGSMLNKDHADFRQDADTADGPGEPAETAGPTVGDQLRMARERIGASVEDIAARLNIKSSHLLALEAGDTERLPGRAYALGFVRSYAAHLALSVAALSDQFKAEWPEADAQPALTFLEPEPQRRSMPSFAVMASSLAAAVMVYFGVVKAPDTPDDATTDVAAIEATVTSQPRDPQGADRSAAKAAAEAETAAADDVQPASVSPIATGQKRAPSAGSAESPAMTAGPAFAPSRSSLTGGQTRPAASDGSAMAAQHAVAKLFVPDATVWSLKATQDVWVHVVDGRERPVFSGMLRPGERRLVPANQAMRLTVSNAAGLTIRRGDQAYDSLGGYGKILENVALDRDALTSLSRLALR